MHSRRSKHALFALTHNAIPPSERVRARRATNGPSRIACCEPRLRFARRARAVLRIACVRRSDPGARRTSAGSIGSRDADGGDDCSG